jgi:citrate lyase subunit beta/citryl-CoA lyase
MSADDMLIDRSLLFVPGSRPERFDKALAAGADLVVIDLEDAVAAADKVSARAALAAWCSSAEQRPGRRVVVRINAADTEWFAEDLAVAAMPGVFGVMLPKAEQVESIDAVATAREGLRVLPLIETAIGFDNSRAIARSPGVQRLVFGTIDFALDLGLDGEDDPLLFFRSRLVLESRLAGIAAPIDGVTVAIDDAEQLRHDTLRARQLGFGGKLCIHPKQVDGVNRHFAPSDAEAAWARRVLDAAAASAGAAVQLDGKMIDKPVILRAEALMLEAARRAA